MRARPGDRARNRDGACRYIASIGQNFNAGPGRGIEGGGIDRVKISAGGEAITVHALNDEELHGPLALRHAGAQLPQMPRRPGRHAVRKLRQISRATQMAVLHLQPAAGPVRILQHEIHPAGFPHLHLPAMNGVSSQFGDRIRRQGLGRQAIGVQGVDPDEAPVGLHQLQGPGELALRPFGRRDPDGEPRRVQAEHGAGVRAMGGDLAAVIQDHIGEEALIALHKTAPGERLGEVQKPRSILLGTMRGSFRESRWF